MKKKYLFTVALSLLFLFNTFLVPLSSLNAQEIVSSKAVYPDDKVENIVEKIKEGEKVKQKETFFAQGEGVVDGRYTVFVKKDSKKKVVQNLKSIAEVNIGGEYDEVVAVPIDISDEKNEKQILSKLDNDPDVVAVTQVARRSLSAVPTPNDPLYPPAGNFTNTYQWYLNQPSGGNYGIDLMRAWQYMDSQGKAWQGDPNLKVAVIDTGFAFETYNDKYDTGSVSWDFSAATDIAINIHSNSSEIAGNGIDDDNNGAVEDTFSSPFDTLYCLDANSNQQCDSHSERTKGYVDDVNGVNLIDFYKYWKPNQVSASPNCTNAPYTSYKCVTQTVCDVSGTSGSDSWGCLASDIGHPNDLAGHGTAVSGIIAGANNNSISGTGIAPGVTVLPIAVFGYVYSAGEWVYNPESGSADYIARAVEYAVAQGAKIINMSFGGTIPDAYEELAIARAYSEDGVLIVAASGNRYSSSVDYPAKYSSVIGVGSVNKDGSRVNYSNYGTGLEISAPVGSGIPTQSYTCYFTGDPSGSYDNPCLKTSTTPSNPSQFTQFSNGLTSGTSFASPQAVGVAALIWTMHPTWSNEQVRYVLKMSSTSVSGYTSTIGYGILNAYNAVRSVDYLGRDLTRSGRLLQATRATNNDFSIRYSDDRLNTWSDWNTSIDILDEPAFVYSANTGKLLQAVRTSNSSLYTRISTDKGLTWGSWVRLGGTSSKISLVDTGSHVILVMRGTDNAIYTRVSTNGGSSWGGWNRSGSSAGPISIAYDGVHQRVVQAMRGMNDGIYTRYSTNNGASWSIWSKSGSTYSNPELVVARDRVLIATRSTRNDILMRYSTNGGASWSSWFKNGSTIADIEMVYTGSRLIQSVRGVNNAIMTRYSSNKGSSWSGWNTSGATKVGLTLVVDPQIDTVYESTVGTNGLIYDRYSTNEGSSWSPWLSNGSSSSPVGMVFIETADW